MAPCGIRAACLDFEHQNLYSLTLSGTDGGGRVTSVNVFIDVLDVNDNPPSFDRVEYRRTVDEGASYFDPPLVVKVLLIYLCLFLLFFCDVVTSIILN